MIQQVEEKKKEEEEDEKGRCMCACVCVWVYGGKGGGVGGSSHKAQQVSHHPTVQEFRLQHCNQLGSKSKVQVHFTLLQYIAARMVSMCIYGKIAVW